jgi:hypothetical protein
VRLPVAEVVASASEPLIVEVVVAIGEPERELGLHLVPI